MHLQLNIEPHDIPEWFWDAIDHAEKDVTKLKAIVWNWDADKLYEFDNLFACAAGELDQEHYVRHIKTEYGLSEDTRDDVCTWVVSQGKEHYFQVLANPELMPSIYDLDGGNLYGIGDHVIYEKFGVGTEEIDIFYREAYDNLFSAGVKSFAFNPATLRAEFPSLSLQFEGRPVVFFDNPGGTQVPQRVIDAVSRYYAEQNANVGGAFLTSQRTDEVLHGARQAMADLLNAPGEENILFGANMTTLTFHLARSIAETIRPGDEIVITNLDHDANVTPWTDLEAAGAKIVVVDVRPETCTLDLNDVQAAITPRTRLVAVTHASNAVGTIPDVAAIVKMAHAVGALVFVDAVQFAPHGPIDVQKLDCDFLACSAYKFFGPHVGILYGKTEHLTSLTPHKVRPAKNSLPYRWETGTLNHEGIAGVGAALDYLASIGERFGQPYGAGYLTQGYTERRLVFKTAMRAIQEVEQTLSRELLSRLQTIPGIRIYGLTDLDRLSERVPTVALTLPGRSPRQWAEHLASHGICCWSGNYYALRLMERLGLEGEGGALRIGLAHYNTIEEIERLHELFLTKR